MASSVIIYKFINPLQHFHNDQVLSGFMFVLPQRDSSGRRVIFHIPRSSMLVLNQSCIIAYFNVFTKKNFFTIRLLDTSHHSMEDVIKVIAITLETLLEDKENQIRQPTLYWICSLHLMSFSLGASLA